MILRDSFFLFLIMFLLFIFDRAGSSLLQGLFSTEASGGCSLVAVQASHVAEPRAPGHLLVSNCDTCSSVIATPAFSSCGFQAQELWRTGLAAPWHVLRGILLDQGSNPCLLDWQMDSLPLSHQRSPETVSFDCFVFLPPEYELYFLVSWYDFSLSVEY